MTDVPVTCPFAPVTPAKKPDNQCPEIRNSCSDEGADEDKDEQLTMDEGDQCCHDKTFSEQMADSSSGALCTPAKENSNTSKREVLEIDLNLTPELKEQKPRRKKHRPKVVIEGKPKRTPKPVVSKQASPMEKPLVKRKYVRRKGLKASNSPTAEVTEGDDPTWTVTESNTPAMSTVKRTRRALVYDFDQEEPLPCSEENVYSEIDRTAHVLPAESNPLAGGKREHYNANNEPHLQPANLVGDYYSSLLAFQNSVSCKDDSNFGLQFPKSCKRKRTEKGQIKRIARDDGLARAIAFGNNDSLQSSNWYSPFMACKYNPQEQNVLGHRVSRKEHSRIAHKRQRYSEIMLTFGNSIWKKKKRSKLPVRSRDVASLSVVALWKKFLLIPFKIIPRSRGCIEALLKTHMKIPKKPRTKRRSRPVNSVLYSRRNQMYLKGYGATFAEYHRVWARLEGGKNASETHEHNALVPFHRDNRIVPYEGLFDPVRERRSRAKYNSIVPYEELFDPVTERRSRAKYNTIVPYEGPFDSVKKQPKQLPKVDLDQETERVWKLLMENDGSESVDETTPDKEKWWKEERLVFSGRVDSFIARMHLVQGDRRYLQWKGSVVDSVIGVFLTQNVTDHFSSSAFMSLAARFPLLSTQGDMAVSTFVCNSKPKQFTAYYTRTRIGKAKFAEADERKALEDVGLSQNSAVSSINSSDSVAQPIERIGSCSNSNSEAEDLSFGHKSGTTDGLTSFMELLSIDGATLLQEYYKCGNERLPLNVDTKKGNTLSKRTELGNGRSCMGRIASLEETFESIYPSTAHLPLAQGATIPCNIYHLDMTPAPRVQDVDVQEVSGEGSRISLVSTVSESSDLKEVEFICERSCPLVEYPLETNVPSKMASLTKTAERDDPYASLVEHSVHPLVNSSQELNVEKHPNFCNNLHVERSETFIPEDNPVVEAQDQSSLPNFSTDTLDVGESVFPVNKKLRIDNKDFEIDLNEAAHFDDKASEVTHENTLKTTGKTAKEKKAPIDWDNLRKEVHRKGIRRERTSKTCDSLDWDAVRCADVNEIADTIKERGMNNMLAARIKDFLNRLVREHESIDLEWLRDVPPDKVKDYLLSIRGLGLKSVECVRLLTLHHLAFPVDTNVARIAVRLGWVPLQPLPEDLQIHLLELYPMLESVQKYLWPRLCTLDQKTLYELHYQMITFGKVFCTKRAPNCNACPMRAECRHFASAFASAKLALPGPEEKGLVPSTVPIAADCDPAMHATPLPLPLPDVLTDRRSRNDQQEPIIEEPSSPEPPHSEITIPDIEDVLSEDPDEIPTIKLSIEEFALNLQNYVQENNVGLQEGDMSKALVALTPEAASIPLPKLKTVTRLRTEHQVYIIPDEHPLLKELQLERREPDDPNPYLLNMWTPGEIAEAMQPQERCCGSEETGDLCNKKTCSTCCRIQEENSQIVRGTLLIPSKTAMRGSFPLNGTYFQVNEVFADHESSLNPVSVPRNWIWNLQRRTVFFGTSVTAIFRGLSTEAIQSCFWRGYVCVRGFDKKTRAPRPLAKRFHISASRLGKNTNGRNEM